MTGENKSILVLEDQPLIALDIEEMLINAGFDDVVVISSCADAEAWLSCNNPNLAVIDVHLRDGVCTNVAKTLVEESIPFVVHSALSSYSYDDGSIFSRGRWIGKPVVPERLISVVREIIAQ